MLCQFNGIVFNQVLIVSKKNILSQLVFIVFLSTINCVVMASEKFGFDCVPVGNDEKNPGRVLLSCQYESQKVIEEEKVPLVETIEPKIIGPKTIEPETIESQTSEKNNEELVVKKIGQKPTADISRIFLLESEVLLKPREVQLSLGIEYAKNDTAQNLRKIRSRTLSFPLGMSVGVTRDTELFASLPLVYAEQEFVTFDDSVKDEKSGAGDFSFGFSHKILPENQRRPSLTLSTTVVAPISKSNESDSGGIELSSGFWGISTAFSVTKSIDPAVLFLSLGYSHRFEEERSGISIQPGDAYNYSFGAGFSINSMVALSGRLIGSYTQDDSYDNKKVIGSNVEPVSLGMGMTYQVDNKNRIETNVNFGLNNDAEDVSFGLNYLINL